MRALILGCCAVAALVVSTTLAVAWAAEGEGAAQPKHTIKEVMKNANAGGAKSLLKKVTSGKATQEERLVLLDHYISLVENKPPKGDMDSWQTLAGRAALAAAKVAVGRDGATAELDTATNCKACHSVHK
jgi:hypothetical protein